MFFVKNLRHYGQIFFAVLIMSMIPGCATIMVHAGLEFEGDVQRELSSIEEVLAGADHGTIFYNNHEYRRIVIPLARHACNSSKAVELLLPLRPGTERTAILREAFDEKSIKKTDVLIYDSVRARPPIFVEGKAALFPTIQTMHAWLEGFPATSELTPIIFGNEPDSGDLIIMYKIVIPKTGVMTVPVSDHLEWVCRDREAYALFGAAYPLAIIVDIATAPLQAIGYLVFRFL
ncbi:MAG: hypothetical protein WC539_04570 [Nitrospirota bacterium]